MAQTSPVGLHAPDLGLIGSDAGFSPGLDHRKGCLERVELIDGILRNIVAVSD